MKFTTFISCVWKIFLILAAQPLFSFADEKQNCVPGLHNVTNTNRKAPPRFTVSWKTTADPVTEIVIEVIREWSPTGADRFYQLVLDNFYNCATFFRVVPGFVIQFGLAAEPEETAKWDHPIVDDTYNVQSNTLGTLSFAMAGPGTRTSQIFVNLADNTNLDSQGFTPFARTISGFSVWHEIYNPTKESGGASQGKLTREGNKWILAEFPDIDLILSTSYEIIENGDDTNDVP
ncbi:hypothetical protein FisN_UnNu121 [Fistulifera solaris]|uniref:Peptidyl-prolyl cis-trans isomerase n=1 Tax=Fistulifera solaris TaxID=1519565 RepID=A0A1Z5KTY1_FISSO|nr:hypothetical protein FisN_UnNu121 [Fistulifera solaris]|eukprot:GAX29632.1 hypothetical protein FisN_UnNu121 [Fistulifera solaris]